ncbi:pantetheinase-like [Dendronephthya gigantea]|uniref:pantetheinase-like n=1 Tax=Dendronephthya gigantea TaxID=151771 RepID=UPI00106C397D|nr:pantetheinase-like [Dendronephthya gigantea]
MKFLQVITSMCSLFLVIPFSTSDTEFIAAVYEHAFVNQLKNKTDVSTRREALRIVMDNMDVYEKQILEAKSKNVVIIVFPEYGLTGFDHTRESFRPFLENIPDPTKQEWNACEAKPDNSTAIMKRLSCLAKNNDIYIVVNMGDIKLCNKTTDPHCPADGRYQYNTNVVFDNAGKLIARYHKQHPFLNEMKVINRPVEPEFITFETPFGRFGTFTCFDALFHDPAIPLVEKYNIDHVVFPTAWFDVLPLFAAIGFHSSWARGMRVNYLAANTHVPVFLNTGSGIYSPTGARSFYRSLTEKGQLLIASLPASPRKTSRNETQINARQNLNYLSDGSKTNVDMEDEFYSDLFGDLFLFKELSKEEDSLKVCYNGSTTCCLLTYKMVEKQTNEMYALGVFDGLHTKEGQYYLRICALIKCLNLDRNSCGQRVYDANTIFNSFLLKSQLNTPYVFPQVVADGVSLLPGEWNSSMPPTSLQTTQKLSKGLLTAALFGRVYNLDPLPSTGSTRPCCAPSVLILACLFFGQSYYHYS